MKIFLTKLGQRFEYTSLRADGEERLCSFSLISDGNVGMFFARIIRIRRRKYNYSFNPCLVEALEACAVFKNYKLRKKTIVHRFFKKLKIFFAKFVKKFDLDILEKNRPRPPPG